MPGDRIGPLRSLKRELIPREIRENFLRVIINVRIHRSQPSRYMQNRLSEKREYLNKSSHK